VIISLALKHSKKVKKIKNAEHNKRKENVKIYMLYLIKVCHIQSVSYGFYFIL